MELDDPAHGIAAMADRSGASHYFDLVDQSRLNQRDVGSWRGPVDGIVQSHSVYEVENGGAGKAANKWRWVPSIWIFSLVDVREFVVSGGEARTGMTRAAESVSSKAKVRVLLKD